MQLNVDDLAVADYFAKHFAIYNSRNGRTPTMYEWKQFVSDLNCKLYFYYLLCAIDPSHDLLRLKLISFWPFFVPVLWLLTIASSLPIVQLHPENLNKHIENCSSTSACLFFLLQANCWAFKDVLTWKVNLVVLDQLQEWSIN